MRRLFALFTIAFLFAAPSAQAKPAAQCEVVPSSPVAAISTFLASNANRNGDWREATVLPYRDGWLDEVVTLSGLVQQDGLASTKHDDWRCGAMVGLAGAIVGGREAFDTLLTRLEKKRGHTRPDGQTLTAIRARFASDTLRAADLHRLGDIVYRAHVGVRGGSSDGQISAMIRASGARRIATRSAKPAVIAASLAPGEAFPMNVDLSPAGKPNTQWHVILVWKDKAGTTRIYDSDRLEGSQVLQGDLSEYISHATAEAPLAAKFTLANPR